MAINDIVQTIAEARVDARSLSEFVFKPAGFKVARRLAPTVDTLQFYINRFNSLNGDFSSSVSVALSSLNNSVAEAQGKVAYIESTVQDAINNTAVEGGVLADTFVVVDGTLSQRTINKGLESIADLSTINNPKDGLRVYVKSYHAGLGKGGGYFTYDSSKGDLNDGGFNLVGWVRDSDDEVVNVLYFGAVGDGEHDCTQAIQAALEYSLSKLKTQVALSNSELVDGWTYDEQGVYFPYGDYKVNKKFPALSFYGEGNLVWQGEALTLNSSQSIKLGKLYQAEARLSARNRMSNEIKDGRLYVVNQGSYGANEQSTLDIYDVSSIDTFKLLSSTDLGVVGDTARALAIYGKYAYILPFQSDRIMVYDVSDPYVPKLINEEPRTFGGVARAVVVNDVLVCLSLSNRIFFYDLTNPVRPAEYYTLSMGGSFVWAIQDGEGFWVSDMRADNIYDLHYVSLADITKPIFLKSVEFPELSVARYPVKQGNYIYLGGVTYTTKLHIIDVSNKLDPKLAATIDDIDGRWVTVSGDTLISSNKVYDISNPKEPVFYRNLDVPLDRVHIYGNYIVGIGEGDGSAGTSISNDSLADAPVYMAKISAMGSTSYEVGHLNAGAVHSENIECSGKISANNIIVGEGGLLSTGAASAKSFHNATGLYNNNRRSVELHYSDVGRDLSKNIPLATVSSLGLIGISITYTVVEGASLETPTKVVHGAVVESVLRSNTNTPTLAFIIPSQNTSEGITKDALGVTADIRVSSAGDEGQWYLYLRVTGVQGTDTACHIKVSLNSTSLCRVSPISPSA